ncbi:hypothetical protein M514_28402 [Trichuris suis]|uniref:Uncharacterized protein n=1 Tax=Trichuris suis TaxID=68888 RepID=A0A085LXH3_9BILA|nr:hypothetical protein M513_14056 [Trichuris suis]KFD49669.1 hypothetical protein M513_09501 [Trichuris suis]KFD59419.1 hypothetical protein M514_28402 [Trichuris suis]
MHSGRKNLLRVQQAESPRRSLCRERPSNNRSQRAQAVNVVDVPSHGIVTSEPADSSDEDVWLNSVSGPAKPIGHKAVVSLNINHQPVEMIYDPGAAQSVISESLWHRLGKPPLKASPTLIA